MKRMRYLFKGLRRAFLLLLLLSPGLAFAQEPDSVVVAPVDEDGTTIGTYTTEGQTYKDVFDQPSDTLQLYQHQLPDSLMNGYRKQDGYWYWNYEPEKPREKKQAKQEVKTRDESPSYDWGYYVLGLAVIGLLVLLLRSNDVKLFAGRNRKVKNGMPQQDMELESIPFEDEISKAERLQDYRIATRLRYLEVLKTLDQQQLIRYHQDEPNSAYVAQLSGNNLQAPFRRLTLHFDYAWYGGFEINTAMYERIKNDFITFKNKMG